jgi:hypothetical protein
VWSAHELPSHAYMATSSHGGSFGAGGGSRSAGLRREKTMVGAAADAAAAAAPAAGTKRSLWPAPPHARTSSGNHEKSTTPICGIGWAARTSAYASTMYAPCQSTIGDQGR